MLERHLADVFDLAFVPAPEAIAASSGRSPSSRARPG